MSADRGRVRERLLEQPVGQEPRRGSPVKLRHGLRTGSGKLDPQKLPEQVVVAIPDPTRIERDQKQVRPLDLGQNASGALGTQHGVAKLRGKTVQNRRSEQKAPRLVLDSVQHLGCQIVGDVTVIGGELPDPLARLVDTGEPERSEADPCRPALRPLNEQLDVLHAHCNAHALDQQLACLLAVERDVVRSQLRQSTPCPQSTQPPAGVRTGHRHHPRRLGKALDGVRERPQTTLAADMLQVIEDDHDGPVIPGQSIQQLVDPRLHA